MATATMSASSSSSSFARRHHPYAPPPSSTDSPQSQSTSQPTLSSKSRHIRTLAPAPPPAPATISASTSANAADDATDARLPPSPPRSRRDPSESPSLGLSLGAGLGAAFGSSGGSKWWDDELPAPPASLSSILDSFRRSGEGDRDLLLSILSAKKAEEERLTALIQTRLTVLQARLSLHSAAAAAVSATQVTLPPPSSSATTTSPLAHPRAFDMPTPPQAPNALNGSRNEERTPSLSSTRGSGSSAGSPPPVNLAPPHPAPSSVHSGYAEKIQLPPIPSIYRRSSPDHHYAPYRHPSSHASLHADDRARAAARKSRSPQPTNANGGPSPDEMRRGKGFEMLLDAGMGMTDQRA